MGSSNTTAKRIKDVPTGDGANRMTPGRWKEFLRLIANGTRKDKALAAIGVTQMTMQSFLIVQEDAPGQYQEAQLVWLRRKWPYELVEEILTDVAMNHRLVDICRARGVNLADFYKVVVKDPLYKEMYETAKQIAMEKMGEDLLELADDIELDGVNTTANSAKVNHARLQVETRKWLMSKLHYRRFGDRLQQDVKQELTVNHAEALDSARRRKEKAHQRKQELAKQKRREERRTVH